MCLVMPWPLFPLFAPFFGILLYMHVRCESFWLALMINDHLGLIAVKDWIESTNWNVASFIFLKLLIDLIVIQLKSKWCPHLSLSTSSINLSFLNENDQYSWTTIIFQTRSNIFFIYNLKNVIEL